MAQFVCVSCGRRGDYAEGVRWHEGTARDVLLDPDETALEDGAYMCGDCVSRLDPEEQPRWKPLR